MSEEQKELSQEEVGQIIEEAKAYYRGTDPVKVDSQVTEQQEVEDKSVETTDESETKQTVTEEQDPYAFLNALPEEDRKKVREKLEQTEARAKDYEHRFRSVNGRYTHANKRLQELEQRLNHPVQKKEEKSLRDLEPVKKLAENESDALYVESLEAVREQLRNEFREELGSVVNPLVNDRFEEQRNQFHHVMNSNRPGWQEEIMLLNENGEPQFDKDGHPIHTDEFYEFLSYQHPNLVPVMMAPKTIEDAFYTFQALDAWRQQTGRQPVNQTAHVPQSTHEENKADAIQRKRQEDLKKTSIKTTAPVIKTAPQDDPSDPKWVQRQFELARKAIKAGNPKLYK